MTHDTVPAEFSGKVVFIGFGSIARAAVPILGSFLTVEPSRILAFSDDPSDRLAANELGVELSTVRITKENLSPIIGAAITRGDVVLNLSVGVCARDTILLCRERGALYVDTGIEPWEGLYTNPELSASQRSNHALREGLRDLACDGFPTAVVTHGANPGLVSHLTKKALLNVAEKAGTPVSAPSSREGWARLSMELGIRTIQVAERDWQVPEKRKAPGEFVNTWSVGGFFAECCQPAELGWGTHERKDSPLVSRHPSGGRASVMANSPGALLCVKTWTPMGGQGQALLITHGESVTIPEYLTVGDPDSPLYRPTVYYAYQPCDDAILSLREAVASGWRLQERRRIAQNPSGTDELGVLLMGNEKTGCHWFGSVLSSEEARLVASHNSATSMQVASSVCAAARWAVENPRMGLLEPEDLPFDRMIDLCLPYLGTLVSEFSDWTPWSLRAGFFNEPLDGSDKWRFENFLTCQNPFHNP